MIDDPLAAMRYQGNRDQNLRSIGVPSSLRESTLQVATRVDRRDGERLARRMQNSERREQLALDLCGQGELPRRYMLLGRWSWIKMEGVRVGSRTSPFEAMGWFDSSLVSELHDEMERFKEGQAMYLREFGGGPCGERGGFVGSTGHLVGEWMD